MKEFYGFWLWRGIIEGIIELLKKIPSWVWRGLIGIGGLFISLLALKSSVAMMSSFDSTGTVKFIAYDLLYCVGYAAGGSIFIHTLLPPRVEARIKRKPEEVLILCGLYGLGSIGLVYFLWR